MGKLPVDPGGFKFLLTTTDYFSKWVEAEPTAAIEETDVIHFVLRNFISRFSILFTIITDNGKLFTGQKYRALLYEYGIKSDTSTPGYPQGNGQAKIANKAISARIKHRLKSRRGKWAEKLPRVLWGYRTTP